MALVSIAKGGKKEARAVGRDSQQNLRWDLHSWEGGQKELSWPTGHKCYEGNRTSQGRSGDRNFQEERLCTEPAGEGNSGAAKNPYLPTDELVRPPVEPSQQQKESGGGIAMLGPGGEMKNPCFAGDLSGRFEYGKKEGTGGRAG